MADQLSYDVIETGIGSATDDATYSLVRYRATGVYAAVSADGASRSVDQKWALARHLVLRRRQLGQARGGETPITQEAAAQQVGISVVTYRRYEQECSSPLPAYRALVNAWLMTGVEP
jgi:hypothetical protein